jgi:5'-nucleotidase
MKMLITNDDGISSNGIITLANRFKEMGEVIVVAPTVQMSATSHSLTTEKPLRYYKHYIKDEFFGYALNGSPADCIKFGILSILEKHKPDIVLSGINFGRNTGVNLFYSGTFAGATEGHLLGIPSFAVSLSSHNPETDCQVAADYAYKIVSNIMLRHDKEKIFLNINVPAVTEKQIKGIKITKSSSSYWDDNYEKRIDPFGKAYFWFNGTYIYDANEEEIDDVAIDKNYVSVTPIRFQFTNLTQIEELRGLEHLDKNLENEPPEFQEADKEIEKVLEERKIVEKNLSEM